MRNRIIIFVLLMLLLSSIGPHIILIRPVQAWSGGNHGDICRSIVPILRWNVEKQGLPRLTKACDFLEKTIKWNPDTNKVDPTWGNEWPYWMIIADGAGDADMIAYNSDGSVKTYNFKMKLLGITLKWDVRSSEVIGKSEPAWLRASLGLFTRFATPTRYATIDQFQEYSGTDKLSIHCTNLRTGGQTAGDYFNLAMQASNSGNDAKAMWWLGMACHMEQDCFTPLHTETSTGWLLQAAKAYGDLCKTAEQDYSSYDLNEDINKNNGTLIDYLYNEKNVGEYGMGPSFRKSGFFNYNYNLNQEPFTWTPFQWVCKSSAFIYPFRKWNDGLAEEHHNRVAKYGLLASQLRTAQFVYYFLEKMGLLDSGLPPSYLQITSPNGGESWEVGSTHSIEWYTSGILDRVKIELSRNGGKEQWETICYNVDPYSSQPLKWIVTGLATKEAVIRISCITALYNDTSDKPFTIFRKEEPIIHPSDYY